MAQNLEDGTTGTCSKVCEKLRSHWSDADLAQHDPHGKSRNHDGNRKSHDRRHGNVNLVNLSDVDDEASTHKQPSELPDGAFGGDGVCHTGVQWEKHEESFERDEDDVQFNDDEDVQSLLESKSQAPAAVSHANRTLTRTRQTGSQRCSSVKTTAAQEVNSGVSTRIRETMFLVSWSSSGSCLP